MVPNDGTAADDVLAGTEDRDEIWGLDGNDTISGLGGNDLLLGNVGDDSLFGGNGDDGLDGGGGNDILDGGDGIDTAIFEPGGVVASLVTNIATGPNNGTDTLVNIENLSGTSTDDTLTGNDGNNRLIGGGGANILQGGGGDDEIDDQGAGSTIDGGAGWDYLNLDRRVSSAALAFTYDAAAGRGALPDGTTFTGIEQFLLLSGEGDDTFNLVGANASHPGQTFFGLSGWNAGGGNNSFVADFSGRSGRIVESLSSLAADFSSSYLITDGAGGTLFWFSSVENVFLTGTAGDDIFESTIGTDVLDGGGGHNRLRYTAAQSGVNVDLRNTGPQDTGGGGTDTLHNFQDVDGGLWGDMLTGTTADNVLDGSSGNDILYSGGGKDTLLGGYGDDFIHDDGSGSVIDGGPGYDTLYLDRSAAIVPISLLLNHSGDKFSGTLGFDGTSISNIQDLKLVTGSGDDSFLLPVYAASGGPLSGNWDAGSGNDVFRVFYSDTQGSLESGWTGNRYEIRRNGDVVFWAENVENFDIHGGDAADIVAAGASNDTVDGGAGDDTVIFSGDLLAYAVRQGGDGTIVSGPDGADILRNVAVLQFRDQAVSDAASFWQRSFKDPAPIFTLSS